MPSTSHRNPDEPADQVVESVTLRDADVTIHAKHPFQRDTHYIDVESDHGSVDTQIRVKTVELNGCDIAGFDRALILENCRITLDSDQTYARISRVS